MFLDALVIKKRTANLLKDRSIWVGFLTDNYWPPQQQPENKNMNKIYQVWKSHMHKLGAWTSTGRSYLPVKVFGETKLSTEKQLLKVELQGSRQRMSRNPNS